MENSSNEGQKDSFQDGEARQDNLGFQRRRKDRSNKEFESNREDDDHLVYYDGIRARYKPPSRKAQIIRGLPVLFVVILIATLYTVYTMYHLLPLLQLELQPQERNQFEFNLGLGEMIAFNILVLLLLVSYILAVIIPPGTVPDDPVWHYPPVPAKGATDFPGPVSSTETKRSGEARHCKWCARLKPDRCHHCRVCRVCVLKMDHHCPWIFNCVGWGNHKYFMLCLIYSLIATLFIAITMFPSVRHAVELNIIPFGEMFLLLFGETLDVFLGSVVCGFFLFHCWLMHNGMTTIEFCEKQFKWKPTGSGMWSRGCYKNFTDVFGPNPLLWFLPIERGTG